LAVAPHGQAPLAVQLALVDPPLAPEPVVAQGGQCGLGDLTHPGTSWVAPTTTERRVREGEHARWPGLPQLGRRPLGSFSLSRLTQPPRARRAQIGRAHV